MKHWKTLDMGGMVHGSLANESIQCLGGRWTQCSCPLLPVLFIIFQLLQARFSANRWRMKTRTSKFEALFSFRKKVECPVQVDSEVILMETFKHLRFLFRSEGLMGSDKLFGAVIAVVWTLGQSIEMKREVNRRARLCLPVNLCFYFHAWPWTVDSDQKNKDAVRKKK